MRRIWLIMSALALALVACVQSAPNVIYITATPEPSSTAPLAQATLTPFPMSAATPTPDPTRAGSPSAAAGEIYTVRPGDTLIGIAIAAGTTLETLLRLNTITNPDTLFVGQQIVLPAPPTEEGSRFKIIPDSRLVRAPGSAQFDIDGFVAAQTGYIRVAFENVNGAILSGAAIVRRVALEYSVDPRLLLALLEFRAGWLTNILPDERLRDYPLGAPATASGIERKGLYRQLIWAADNLNRGYYGWKQRSLSRLEFTDGTRLLIARDLNAGTVGVQFMLALNNDSASWQNQVSGEGFYQTYFRLHGDPFLNAVEPLVPPNLQQPTLGLPFSEGETWFFTGGAHGGWGSGSAWAAIDFAPPDDLSNKTSSCYVSDFFATALAPGVIARTDEGVVILDLDGDGDESTGWSVLYLHIASQDRIAAGARVNLGDRIGRPSCEGGFSNGTHIHIARRYNGEWIPASCPNCPPDYAPADFVLNGWTVVALPNQEYQGFLVKDGAERIAEQFRGVVENRVSW
jgi:LysM repeat protein